MEHKIYEKYYQSKLSIEKYVLYFTLILNFFIYTNI